MQDEIHIIDGKQTTCNTAKNAQKDSQKAYIAWFPHVDREMVILSHKSQKIKIAGKVKAT